jgi:tRNA threonylcarbamoyladenosine biosynthesis protein TsaB
MTLILAIETSTTTCGIALLREQGGDVVITTRLHEGTSGHAMSVLPLAQALLDEAGVSKNALDAVCFGQGPGAFTGLRVACGVAQGMGMALDIPVIPVGCLPAVAAKAGAQRPDQLIIAALDARMDEIYLAAYFVDSTARLVTVQPAVLLSAADAAHFVSSRLSFWLRDTALASVPCLVGEGWNVPAATQGIPTDWPIEHLAARPEADWLARLALDAWRRQEVVAPEHAAPLYLRDKVAFTTAERALGQGGNPRANLSQDVALLPMRQVDIPEVLEIERTVQSHPWSAQNFADALVAGYEAWVLRNQQGVVGFCLGMLAPDVAHVLVIAVAPHLQKKGYGHLLLEQLQQSARQRGLEGLLLEVRPSNLHAIDFYLSHGFVNMGLRRDYYPAGKGLREDAQVMKKTFGDT